MNKQSIIEDVEILLKMYKCGELGGEVMPEDANPKLKKDSLENYLYFTLPMALNYQRNSYKLWESALKTYQDKETNFVFCPKEVLKRGFKDTQKALTKYKVALQKEKQTEIWITLCETIETLFEGDIRQLFEQKEKDVNIIRNYIQKEKKRMFPYLSGTKICNYWLYVIWQYTNQEYRNLEDLNVAPDTHVIKSTYQLGLITEAELNKANVQEIVIERWNELFHGSKYKPIDIHTALWLWSRNGFKPLRENCILKSISSSSEFVSDNSKHVKINEVSIDNLLKEYTFITSSHWLSTNPFYIFELSSEELVNFLILYDAINFSFWGDPKWTIKTEESNIDGSIALMYALLKIKNQKGKLNFEEITYQDFKKGMKGNVEIPFLKERYEILKEMSRIINEKMEGNFYNYTIHQTKDQDLFKIIIESFPNFKDERTYKGEKIFFYKLAQLATSDILHIRELKEEIKVDYSHLVGCADYKIPQAMRALKILEYDNKLSSLIDNNQELQENSEYEVEIRANMIVALQKIQDRLPKKSLIEINDFIWILSQNKDLKRKPYHKTRTMSY